MSQARAIENDYVLRLLPLPGRSEGVAQDRLAAEKAAERGLQETRGIATQSHRPDSHFNLNFSTNNASTPAAANMARQNQRGTQTGSGLNLSDDVVSFLLSANEVAAVDTPESNFNLQVYQEVTASFPRSKPSLFSLAV